LCFFAYGGYVTELKCLSFCDANGDDFFAEK
jgi:hypothetical protein